VAQGIRSFRRPPEVPIGGGWGRTIHGMLLLNCSASACSAPECSNRRAPRSHHAWCEALVRRLQPTLDSLGTQGMAIAHTRGASPKPAV
jgi:hypothetical protein